MQTDHQEDILDPKYSNFSITQSVAKHLFEKYHESCCFFKAKEVNRLIFGDRQEKKVIDFRDILAISEDIQYLKKYYRAKNQQGRNQLKERMRLLKNYYVTSDMLKYEYPMMVINNLEQVFLKRNKLYKKLSKEQESEEEQESSSQSKSEIKFIKGKTEEEEYVIDLSWSQIVAGKFEEENPDDPYNIAKSDLSYEQEEYEIYDGQKEVKRVQFLKKMGITKETGFKLSDNDTSEDELDHLIIDFDDLDRHKIVQQYCKLMDKENQGISSSYSLTSSEQKPSLLTSMFEDRKPLSSSIIVQGKDKKEKKKWRDKAQKNKQSMFIGSHQERFQEYKVMKRSSLMDYENVKKRSFNFEEEEFIISQKEGQQSPSSLLQKQDCETYFLPKKEISKEGQSQFLTETFGKKQRMNMKQLDHEFVQMEDQKNRWDTAKIKADLLKFKEKPFELGQYIDKFQKDVFSCSKQKTFGKWTLQREKQRDQDEGSSTPSKTLTRVKSVENLGQGSINLNYTKRSKYR